MDKKSKKTIILPLIEEKRCSKIIEKHVNGDLEHFIFLDKRASKFDLLKLLRESKRETTEILRHRV